MLMKRNNAVVILILVIWFVISFVTNILGPLMPIIIETYHLSLTLAAFLPFSFFLAYGIMSIPSGMMIESVGEKKSMLIAFGLNLVGALTFSMFPSYAIALFSLFILGAGMAMLQVIINPLMRTAGGEENFAFYSVLGQLVFGLASFVSPFIFSYLIRVMAAPQFSTSTLFNRFSILQQDNMHWIILYWIFTVVFLLMLVLIGAIKMPVVKLNEDEKAGSFGTYMQLIKRKEVILFFLGIVAYVGTEQGIANWMSEFLKRYHHLDPAIQGAKAVAWFWGLMSVGCLVGLVALKLWDSKIILKIASVAAMLTLTSALLGNAAISWFSFAFLGFVLSVMFSIIFSLALNSFSQHHGSFSGILCSGIFGGALIPLVIGALGDIIGLKPAMMVIYITLGYILFIAFFANPLVNNKTISFKELVSKKAKG